jgi:hypothetical protein
MFMIYGWNNHSLVAISFQQIFLNDTTIDSLLADGKPDRLVCVTVYVLLESSDLRIIQALARN